MCFRLSELLEKYHVLIEELFNTIKIDDDKIMKKWYKKIFS